MTFIAQHYCFDGEPWLFPDLPHMGAYHQSPVYHTVAGWNSFEPLISQIEGLDYADLWRCAGQVPYEWYKYDGEGLFDLVEALYRRRSFVRNLITQFRDSSQNPFPNWKENDRSRLYGPYAAYY